MTVQEEVIRIGKKLEKLISQDSADHASAGDLLKALKSIPITLEVLQKTRIGVTVNKYRKASQNDDFISQSKSLIKAWKKLVGGDSGGDKGHDGGNNPGRRCSSASARTTSTASSIGSLGDSMEDESPPLDTGEKSPRDFALHSGSGDSKRVRNDSMLSTDSQQNSSFPDSNEESDVNTSERRDSLDGGNNSGLQLSPTSTPLALFEVDSPRDPTRIKCREMLTTALVAPPTVDGGKDCETVAAEVEYFVYKQFENTDMKYKNRIRSRITNLKDVKNPKLKENLLLGHITTKHFSMMTPEEMASDEMKKLREKLATEAFNDHQMATQSGTQSDLFVCNKCHKRDTSYNQLQTRSSDEPMTTFVLCNNCGNRWKMN